MRNELRQAELHRVLGRHLTAKLVQAKWIIPVRDETGHVRFDERSVHRAVKRLRRGGLALDGYAQRPIVTSVRAKRSGDPLADLTIDIEDELRRFSGPETKTPLNLH